jgi:hypothetical protein
MNKDEFLSQLAAITKQITCMNQKEIDLTVFPMCEICSANEEYDRCYTDIFIYYDDLNWHCRDLYINRESRQNKNFKPTNTVF